MNRSVKFCQSTSSLYPILINQQSCQNPSSRCPQNIPFAPPRKLLFCVVLLFRPIMWGNLRAGMHLSPSITLDFPPLFFYFESVPCLLSDKTSLAPMAFIHKGPWLALPTLRLRKSTCNPFFKSTGLAQSSFVQPKSDIFPFILQRQGMLIRHFLSHYLNRTIRAGGNRR